MRKLGLAVRHTWEQKACDGSSTVQELNLEAVKGSGSEPLFVCSHPCTRVKRMLDAASAFHAANRQTTKKTQRQNSKHVDAQGRSAAKLMSHSETSQQTGN